MTSMNKIWISTSRPCFGQWLSEASKRWYCGSEFAGSAVWDKIISATYTKVKLMNRFFQIWDDMWIIISITMKKRLRASPWRGIKSRMSKPSDKFFLNELVAGLSFCNTSEAIGDIKSPAKMALNQSWETSCGMTHRVIVINIFCGTRYVTDLGFLS